MGSPLLKGSYCNASWQWMVLEKLNKKSLESKLTYLAKKEKQDWSPLFYNFKGDRNGKEISAEDRLAAAEWQSAASVECSWNIETRFDAISLFDDVVRKFRVGNRLKIPVAAATLCISAKLNDEDQDAKPAPHIIRTVGINLTSKEISRMEILLLEKLNWCVQPCLALMFLQVMMALLTIRASVYDQNELSCESLLTVFLEIQLRILYTLMIHPESAGLRPSVLALCVIYCHLDWDNNPTLKGELVPYFQAILLINDEELNKGLTFTYPIIGKYFYNNIPQSKYQKLVQNLPSRSDFKERVTLYDRLVMDLIYSSDVYVNFLHQRHFLCPCAPKSSTKCLIAKGEHQPKKRNIPSRNLQPRRVVNKIRYGNRVWSRLRRRTSKQKEFNKENVVVRFNSNKEKLQLKEREG